MLKINSVSLKFSNSILVCLILHRAVVILLNLYILNIQIYNRHLLFDRNNQNLTSSCDHFWTWDINSVCLDFKHSQTFYGGLGLSLLHVVFIYFYFTYVVFFQHHSLEIRPLLKPWNDMVFLPSCTDNPLFKNQMKTWMPKVKIQNAYFYLLIWTVNFNLKTLRH